MNNNYIVNRKKNAFEKQCGSKEKGIWRCPYAGFFVSVFK